MPSPNPTAIDSHSARAEGPAGLSVAVLAGGRSSRMGTDKALLALEPNGPTLLEIVLERARQLSDDCFVVATDRPEYARFGARVVPDDHPGTGVLGGIATALRAAEHERCLLVSCDHPFLSVPLLRAMTETPGEWDVLVPVLPGVSRQGGTLVRQTLHAIYGRGCLPAVERALTGGNLQVIGFFPEVRVRELDEAACRVFDPNLRSFFSVNTPDALAQARAWRTEERGEAGDR